MEDFYNKYQQSFIEEVSKANNFFVDELKVINETIESLNIGNAQTEQDMHSTREVIDLFKELKQKIIVAIDEMFEPQSCFSRGLKVIKEKIESLKDGKVEIEEGMFHTKEMEDLLEELQQNVRDEMSQKQSFVSRELEVINAKIEKLKAKKPETYLGMEFFDLYSHEGLIGEGSKGRVYRFRDLGTGKVCAMKSIGLVENHYTPELAREISTRFEIEHDNIVKLEKVHLGEGSLYLVMEYGGENLSTLIQKGGKFNGNIAKVWLKALLVAIDFLHERDLIHCNLKPENILIGSDLKLKIAGFGSVRSIFDDMILSPALSTREVIDLFKELKQKIIVAIDEMFEPQSCFSRGLKVIKEKIESLKDGKVEIEEGMFHTKEMEDLLEELQQNVRDEMSQKQSFVSRELEVINAKIEKLKAKKPETYLGMEFFDLYSHEGLIGEGSKGRVYRFRDLGTGKVCAMKSIGLVENHYTPELAREISTRFEIEHDNIVKLEKVHLGEGSLYLVMEYGGENLSTLIQKGGKFNGNIAKVWLKALLVAIDFLHERDLIHCNLKPENILIGSDLKLKIAGFGSVRSIFDDMILSPAVPTILFKAPELLLGSNGYAKPVDIWAIGCIFAEMVEGKSLFGSGDKSDIDISILHEIFRKIGTPSQNSWLFSLPNFPSDVHQYPEASEIIPNLDAVGNDLIKKMLAADPRERITARDALQHPYIKCFEGW